MSALQTLCTHYPKLSDVWTNDLSSFLLPNVSQMRKQMAVVCYEVGWRGANYYADPLGGWPYQQHEQTKQRRLWCGSRIRFFWLTSDMVIVINPAKYHRILHVLNDGHVHCMNRCSGMIYHSYYASDSITSGQIHVWFDRRRQVRYQRLENVHQHRGGYWGRECTEELTHCPDTDVNVCVNRAVLLHSIRNR
jgi:hypothetical protein